jgi:predicted transcriptional regulator
MVNSRRSEPDIISDILRLASDGAGKTRIVYGGNLNHSRAEGYIALLVDRGLLENVSASRRKVYRTTERGRDLLERLDNVLPAIRNGSAA